MAKNGKKGFKVGHDESIGKGSFANMPGEVMMQEYPKYREGRNQSIDDTVVRIDKEGDQMYGKRSRNMSDQH